MKDAMKARDTNRLNVLRTLLAEITNASKTSNPIKTDLQLLSLLRKRAAASRSAAEEFSNANRGDLQEKELAQVSVLESYAKGVDLIGEEEMKDAASSSIERLKADGAQITLGPVLRSLIGPGGVLENKHVDKAQLSAIVKGLL
ncbi:hypothetical protein MMC25_007566 [Agyrium rufum]|nr:hypothetical protein [Agyrium rufum]